MQFFENKKPEANRPGNELVDQIDSGLTFLRENNSAEQRMHLDLGIVGQLQKNIAKVEDVQQRNDYYRELINLLLPIAQFRPKLHEKIRFIRSAIEPLDHPAQPQ